jgi:Fe-S cluster assembly protein SufD
MSTPLCERIAADFASATGAATPSAARRSALAALSAQGLPGGRDENWKYANLRPLERVRFVPAPAADAPLAAALPEPLPGYTRYVFIDGAFAPGLSAPLAGGALRLRQLSGADASPPARVATGDARFALLNEAFATDGLAITVPAGAAAAQLELLFVARADAQAGASYPRLQVQLEPHTQLALIERHVSAASDASFITSAVTVNLGRNAALKHYRLQELAARATLIDTLTASLAESADYRLHVIATGAQSARSTLVVRLAGERAQLALAVAALGDRQQVQDHLALIEHQAPRVRSEQTFRGIAAGRARVAFNGKIVVSREALGTDSQQSLRGLLAGPEAEIDLRPQLEIYTDEVRCSHGATAGKLDEQMLFYLLSRGLDRDSAQRLLKWAFLEDVVAKTDVPQLRRQIEASLAGHLADETLLELL